MSILKAAFLCLGLSLCLPACMAQAAIDQQQDSRVFGSDAPGLSIHDDPLSGDSVMQMRGPKPNPEPTVRFEPTIRQDVWVPSFTWPPKQQTPAPRPLPGTQGRP